MSGPRYPRVLEQFGTPENPSTVAYELLYLAHQPTHFMASPRRDAVRTVVLLKDSFLHFHAERAHEIPATFFATSFPVSDFFHQMVRPHVEATSAPLGVIGDLDPHALCQYLALSRGNAAGVPAFDGAEWLGVDDDWIPVLDEFCGDSLSLTITMNDAERQLLADLETDVDLESLIGPRTLALLRSGRKLEIEGASNPRAYREGFATALIHYVTGRVRRPR